MLKAILLRNKIENKKKLLEKLREKDSGFKTREKELEAAIEDMNEETSDEDREIIENKVSDLDKEKKENDDEKSKIEEEIEELETELDEIEKNEPKPAERKKETKMENRTKFFGMNMEERDAFFNDENVKKFLSTVRSAISDKRAIQNAGLLIPTNFLGVLRENILKYSKLYARVTTRRISGKGREVIAGTIPEAVWTEMCKTLNELSLSFNDVEVDGYMVGGYFAVCRATLDDSDIDLAAEIITALGQSIGYALDKAIVYGKDVKMPLGIVTRLAQTTQPTDYPTTARTWVDLSTSNILKLTGSGVSLFKAILGATSAMKGKYSKGTKTWLMNEVTYTKLIGEAMTTNMAGAIVSGVNNTMPVIGGDIVILDFIPDGDVVAGYFDLYLLSEREGTRIETSDHNKFIEDRRVFKGLARYDGTPVIAEGFELLNINNVVPTTSIEFAQDKANEAPSEAA